jgi:hypothetical protein
MVFLKRIFLVVMLLLISVAIAYTFWQQELKFTKPTPVPTGYVPVAVSTNVDIGILNKVPLQKPVHLHFYNPDCPCSRFNLTHFESLVKKYEGQIDFYVVIPSQNSYHAVNEKFEGKLPVLVDADDRIAESCGVYSTPQAVIIDTSGKLYYRGNYNKSRYCTDIKTNFAQMALDSILADKPFTTYNQLATTSYGCEITEQKQPLNLNLFNF